MQNGNKRKHKQTNKGECMKIAQRCPICQGSGNVPGGFYSVCAGHTEGWTSATTMEKCRTCVDGLVYVEQEVLLPACEHIMVDDNRTTATRKTCVLCGHTE